MWVMSTLEFKGLGLRSGGIVMVGKMLDDEAGIPVRNGADGLVMKSAGMEAEAGPGPGEMAGP